MVFTNSTTLPEMENRDVHAWTIFSYGACLHYPWVLHCSLPDSIYFLSAFILLMHHSDQWHKDMVGTYTLFTVDHGDSGPQLISALMVPIWLQTQQIRSPASITPFIVVS